MDIQNKHSIFISVVTVLLVSLIVWVGVDVNDKIKQGEDTISVTATGEVYAKPDLVLTSFSVLTEAKTVIEALSANTEKMNAIIAFIKSENVADKDIKTVGFNISPRYEWYDKGTRRVLVGYDVQQTLQVKIRDLAKIGSIIQGATDQGANQVSDLQFTIDNEDELQAQARTQAITEAKAKAKELTSQLGVSLGKVVQFSEGGISPVYYMAEATTKGIGGGGVPAPQIETGENKIAVTVYITYKIY